MGGSAVLVDGGVSLLVDDHTVFREVLGDFAEDDQHLLRASLVGPVVFFPPLHLSQHFPS